MNWPALRGDWTYGDAEAEAEADVGGRVAAAAATVACCLGEPLLSRGGVVDPDAVVDVVCWLRTLGVDDRRR